MGQLHPVEHVHQTHHSRDSGRDSIVRLEGLFCSTVLTYSTKAVPGHPAATSGKTEVKQVTGSGGSWSSLWLQACVV